MPTSVKRNKSKGQIKQTIKTKKWLIIITSNFLFYFILSSIFVVLANKYHLVVVHGSTIGGKKILFLFLINITITINFNINSIDSNVSSSNEIVEGMEKVQNRLEHCLREKKIISPTTNALLLSNNCLLFFFLLTFFFCCYCFSEFIVISMKLSSPFLLFFFCYCFYRYFKQLNWKSSSNNVDKRFLLLLLHCWYM